MAIKMGSGDKKASFNEINITPLTDIFLVLLIIMMVIAPGFQSVDNKISIPEINSGTTITEKKATVALTENGELFLNDEPVGEDELAQKLAQIKDTLEEKQVVVKADEKAKSSEIMKIMRSAQEAGFEKLVVVGEPLTKKEQKKLQDEAK